MQAPQMGWVLLLATRTYALLQYGLILIIGSSAMAYLLRPYRRFPIFSPVRYEIRLHDGHGTVTNLSRFGLRIHGNVPLKLSDVCSMKVTLPTRKWLSVAAGIVRWVSGEECGIEMLVMNDESQEKLNDYLQERINAL